MLIIIGSVILALLLAAFAYLRLSAPPDSELFSASSGTPAGSADLGLMLQDGTDSGLYVLAVTEHGPAAEAGVQAGDELLTLGGVTLSAQSDLERVLAAWDGTSPLTMTLSRASRQLTIDLTITP